MKTMTAARREASAEAAKKEWAVQGANGQIVKTLEGGYDVMTKGQAEVTALNMAKCFGTAFNVVRFS